MVHCLTVPSDAMPVGALNVGVGKSHTVLEAARVVSEVYRSISGRPVPVYLGDGSMVDWSEVPREFEKGLFYSNEKLKSTGFAPSIPLESGVRDLVEYVRSAFGGLEV